MIFIFRFFSEFAAVKVNLEVYHTEKTIENESFDFVAAYPNSEEFVTSLDTELTEVSKNERIPRKHYFI
jgi:hypothetical protein